MAKTMHKIEAEQGYLSSLLPSGSYWENWFNAHATPHSTNQHLDEHHIWEKAVNLGILAMDKGKR